MTATVHVCTLQLHYDIFMRNQLVSKQWQVKDVLVSSVQTSQSKTKLFLGCQTWLTKKTMLNHISTVSRQRQDGSVT